MNVCEELRDKLSGYIDNELTPLESDEVKRHISSCNFCEREYKMLQAIRQSLKSMLPKTASRETQKNILNKVFILGAENYSEKSQRIYPLISKTWKQERAIISNKISIMNRGSGIIYRGMALAASLLLFIFIATSDTTSSPLKLYILEHQRCMSEGHMDYLCKTEHELSQKIENSMGVKAFIPTYFPEGFKFIKGDVCNIKGVTVAHMVMSDGKRILSYFQGKDVKSPLTPPFSKGGHGGINAGRLENYKYAHWKKDGVYCIIVGDIADDEIEKIASSQHN